MEWSQTFTLGGTLITYMTAIFVFLHKEHKQQMDKMDAKLEMMEKNHREDMQHTDRNHREDMQMMDAKLEKMESKWERLFERLLLQDKERSK